MKIPKTLTLNCLCGEGCSVDLTFDAYGPVPLGVIHCDFVYCAKCQAPIAFLLPEGLAKRNEDRYSMIDSRVEEEAKGPTRGATAVSLLPGRAKVRMTTDEIMSLTRA